MSRHKARLAAELTKTRLKRGFASVDALRAHVDALSKSSSSNEANPGAGAIHPRWIRINTLRTSLDEQLQTTFTCYSRTKNLADVTGRGVHTKLIYLDQNVPNLVAIPASIDFINETAYKEGNLILQDKASCFPALLLEPGSLDGHIIDACAAPGNKTTHLASLLNASHHGATKFTQSGRIFACERDTLRSQTLAKMVKLSNAEDIVKIKAKQDFMKLDPNVREFSNVTGLLLDPSCSGSGIVGRDEVKLSIHLPDASAERPETVRGKKRKRKGQQDSDQSAASVLAASEGEEVPTQLDASDSKLQSRLSALSTFQLRLLQHAMSFPSAQRITFSTCSVHSQENENVIVQALLSDVAAERGWRILRRQDQVEGLRKWQKRGSLEAVVEALGDGNGSSEDEMNAAEISNACIRCEKNSEDGTMGFFVAGFVRDAEPGKNGSMNGAGQSANGTEEMNDATEDYEDEWSGFSDEDT